MTAPSSSSVPAPSARKQLTLLWSLWWRHVRRRAARVGEAPKLSGVPTFLLINLLSVGYLAPLVWRAVTTSMLDQRSLFAWHMLGVLLIALGGGLTQGAGTLQVRGMRNDAFLEPLPLTLAARLGLQLADGAFIMLLALVVPLAGVTVTRSFGSAVVPALLGLLGYVSLFMVGQACVAWARALGPQSIAKRAAYAGIGFNLSGLVLTIAPITSWLGSNRFTRVLTELYIGGGDQLAYLTLGLGALAFAAYRGLLAAERVGFDRLGIQGSTPVALKGVQTRVSLEWQMIWRQGGKALLIVYCIALPMLAWPLLLRVRARVPPELLLFFSGFAVYLGAIQTLGQAGRAARADLMARPFLASLPLAPHEVLDGKARALRKLLVPVLITLALIGAYGASIHNTSLVFRSLLALSSLYIAVDGAVGVAFLSSGVGVVGVSGGQASSSFSTQLLMMPLLTTVMAQDSWAASVSFLAVIAVTLEVRRAAKMSVRWLDDADSDIERETTVWRALLAATAFFAMQIFSARLLDLFGVPMGYMMAIAFGLAALLLALLTYRNAARFERPRFTPRALWWWPLGLVAGAGSGALALGMVQLVPSLSQHVLDEQVFSTGELIAGVVTMVVMAPLAEEYFFRGWLQKAIERDLPERYKRYAFVLGGLAFALAHVGSYGVPQLVLGLIAGALYAFGGGLWPGILAHAAHNGVVLLLGTS